MCTALARIQRKFRFNRNFFIGKSTKTCYYFPTAITTAPLMVQVLIDFEPRENLTKIQQTLME